MQRVWSVGTLFGLLLFALACDKARPLSENERRVDLRATATTLCPNDQTLQAQTTLIATVFGADGSVSGDVPVSFTADVGSFSEAVVRTNDAGQAVTQVLTPRPPGDELTVVATLPDGRSDDVNVTLPPRPTLAVRPSLFTPEGDTDIDLNVIIGSACNVRRIRLTLVWSPADLLTFKEGKETGVLNGLDDAGVAFPTNLSIVSSTPGRLVIDYARTESVAGRRPTGADNSATYLQLIMHTANVTEDKTVDFQLPGVQGASFELFDSTGTAYDLSGRITIPQLVIRKKTT